jgi:prepilin-type N-terminal cleavage/methylation domain-containing protein
MFRKVANRRKGFSLVELSVVVIIIGVLAAFGVPRMLQAVERSKASEAFGYLAAVRGAQERYQAREGTYTTTVTELDIDQDEPKYFDITSLEVGTSGDLEDSWKMTLTRKDGSSGYGNYTVIFTEEGFDSTNSTITQGEAAAINPMGG